MDFKIIVEEGGEGHSLMIGALKYSQGTIRACLISKCLYLQLEFLSDILEVIDDDLGITHW